MIVDFTYYLKNNFSHIIKLIVIFFNVNFSNSTLKSIFVFCLCSIVLTINFGYIDSIDATTRDIGPQFFDSQGNSMMMDDHIFEVGEQIQIQNEIFNDNIDSNQKGTLELLIQDYRSGQTIETS